MCSRRIVYDTGKGCAVFKYHNKLYAEDKSMTETMQDVDVPNKILHV